MEIVTRWAASVDGPRRPGETRSAPLPGRGRLIGLVGSLRVPDAKLSRFPDIAVRSAVATPQASKLGECLGSWGSFYAQSGNATRRKRGCRDFFFRVGDQAASGAPKRTTAIPELWRISRQHTSRVQVPRVAFGPFKVKASFGATMVASQASANAFLRALGPPHRTTYHWKVAERMLEVAWSSAEAENFAAQAFKIALETEGWLIG
jgi:hypothetical protein